ncbi:MAG: glutathione peroxidase [Mariprofundus sp.]|nr:glutathione peroxidase [Mariprofundus sp.]
MRYLFWLTLIISIPAMATPTLAEDACPQILNHKVKTLVEHQTVSLCNHYRGKVLLVVNTASHCAYTRQYEGLEKLYSSFQEKGLVVLGFPSNDFGKQEPGTEAEVKSFCRLTYDVKFPMFAKSHVRAGIASPFYTSLATAAGQYPLWNFHKYLIGRDGGLIASYGSNTEPNSKRFLSDIRQALKEQ